MNGFYKLVASTVDSAIRATPLHAVDLGNGVARVNFSHGIDSKQRTGNDYRQMFSSMVEAAADLQPETLELVSETRMERVLSGICIANTQSKPYSEAIGAGTMKVVKANVFMDDEDGIWRVVGEGEQRRLVQTMKENFGGLLQARIARSQGAGAVLASTAARFVGTPPVTGQLAAAFSPESLALRVGVVAQVDNAGFMLVNAQGEQAETLPLAAVIATVNQPELTETREFILAAADPDKKRRVDRVLNMLRQLYGGTPMFAQYEKVIRKSLNNGSSAV